MALENRVVVSPMATYSAVDGTPGDFHLVHYGARAMGGAGLVFTEMTCVSPTARITPGCTGMWSDEQAAAWRRITDFVHANGKAKILPPAWPFGRQGVDPARLGDDGCAAGRRELATGRGERRRVERGQCPARADDPRRHGRDPRPVRRRDRPAIDAGFDMVELHAAHGYLLSSFITPLQNKRDDDYGGSLANRLRYPLEVFRGDARGVARRPTDVGAHFRDRLGRRRRRNAR